ncbi:MAG: RsmF rRNA methyltransferase first C-terminal domain-containing protein [Lachnospiraceae bacterium]|jgi:NOL1/NOP2/sun family putative RNA methylase
MNLPEEYCENMRKMLGDEYDSYLASFDAPRKYGLRVNTLKIKPDEFARIAPFPVKRVPWIGNGFYYEGDDISPAKDPYYLAGLYYLQEPSAMTPASLLPVKPGDAVLDTCAAPGGKSTELGARLEGRGVLVSNDISISRTRALLRNIEGFGIGNTVVLSESLDKLKQNTGTFFDAVLVDAPCSGEGMFRKDAKLIKAWGPERPAEFSALQKSIVLQAADMVKPGGWMLYSTCTFNELEDEGTVRFLLDNRPELSLVPAGSYEGFRHGFVRDSHDASLHLGRCIRIFPHVMDAEGHFIALFQKNEKAPFSGSVPPVMRREKLPDELKDFLAGVKMDIPQERITIRDDRAFLLPEIPINTRGLRVMRNGLLLGEYKKGSKKSRFEPSEALAMALPRQGYENCLDLARGDERVVRYLKGETITSGTEEASDGTVLITLEGWPLGWGRKNRGQIKNRYLPGWRLQ